LQDLIRILENTFSFWVLSETLATFIELPFLQRSVTAYHKTSAMFLFISTMIGLGAYSGGIGVSSPFASRAFFRTGLS
jgi:hypothetical protein